MSSTSKSNLRRIKQSIRSMHACRRLTLDGYFDLLISFTLDLNLILKSTSRQLFFTQFSFIILTFSFWVNLEFFSQIYETYAPSVIRHYKICFSLHHYRQLTNKNHSKILIKPSTFVQISISNCFYNMFQFNLLNTIHISNGSGYF